jgi:hypothetical protein
MGGISAGLHPHFLPPGRRHGGNLSFEKIKKDYKATAFACFGKLFRMDLLGGFLLAWLG